MTRARALVLILALASVAGCTNRSRTDPTVAEQVADHLCAIEDVCECAPRTGECRAATHASVWEWEAAAQEAGLELDADCLSDYLAHIDSLASCDRVTAGRTCPVYSGGLGEGQPCTLYAVEPVMTDCARGLFCGADVHTGERRCRNPDRAPALLEGEPCKTAVFAFGACAPELACNILEMTCVATLADGETCERFAPPPCGERSYCQVEPPDPPDPEVLGVCTPKLDEPGAACVQAEECVWGCTPDAGTCSGGKPTLCDTLSYLQPQAR